MLINIFLNRLQLDNNSFNPFAGDGPSCGADSQVTCQDNNKLASADVVGNDAAIVTSCRQQIDVLCEDRTCSDCQCYQEGEDLSWPGAFTCRNRGEMLRDETEARSCDYFVRIDSEEDNIDTVYGQHLLKEGTAADASNQCPEKMFHMRNAPNEAPTSLPHVGGNLLAKVDGALSVDDDTDVITFIDEETGAPFQMSLG